MFRVDLPFGRQDEAFESVALFFSPALCGSLPRVPRGNTSPWRDGTLQCLGAAVVLAIMRDHHTHLRHNAGRLHLVGVFLPGENSVQVRTGGKLTWRQNPSTNVGDECVLIRGFYYCVEVNFFKMPRPVLSTLSPPPVSSTASQPPDTLLTSTTATTAEIATPTPIQAGIAGNCNRFRPVEPGDGCASIAAASGVALDDFYFWNPALGATCDSLWAGYYVCVGVVGSPTTTSSGNGVVTPTPIQSGITNTCKNFHSVVSGDSCYDIAAAAGVTLDQFYIWNPTVNSNCASLWVGYNVCVAVL